jgi:hypothetical protein
VLADQAPVLAHGAGRCRRAVHLLGKSKRRAHVLGDRVWNLVVWGKAAEALKALQGQDQPEQVGGRLGQALCPGNLIQSGGE